MTGTSRHKQSSGFSHWLRTGRVPRASGADGLELKFNPWHDPADGRFTFAGAGDRHAAKNASQSIRPDSHRSKAERRDTPRPATAQNIQPSVGQARDNAATGSERTASGSRRGHDPRPIAEFVAGAAQGVYDVGKGAVTGVRDVLTTNPLTTARNIGLGAAGLVDAATAAENTPALTHIARTRKAIADASAREIGHAAGSVAGNVALTVSPGAALSKGATLRRLRLVPPRPTFDPPQVGWVKENLKEGAPATLYNDAAPGARPGQAPTLMHTTADGSKRPVKFDGVQGDYLIDRKTSIMRRSKFIEQLKKQSEVLAQHRLIGVWEVPNHREKAAALRLFKKHGITNINVRIAAQ